MRLLSKYTPRMADPKTFEELRDDCRQEFNDIGDKWVLPEVFELLSTLTFEKGTFRNGGGLTVDPVTDVISGWDSFTIANPANTTMKGDPVTGQLTVGVAGAYKFTGFITFLGSGTNENYVLGVRQNGGAIVDYATVLWNNQTAALTFNWSFISAELAVGDVIELTLTTNGTFTNTNAQSNIECVTIPA